ncbi:MAG: HRDC domain-containing protein [Deltaproteobacteria bacterium]|nr:HRDC domain-containing protein [Deltaproteobacteria bacterium]
MTTAPWIRTPDQLDDLVDALRGVRAIGIDTEADSLHHYAEQVCLIQLAALGGDAWLIDPLALRDLSPLAPILADGSVVKVLHGGDNDITSLRRDFGFRFRTVFDTGLAARLLGDTELGLQALVRNELGIELHKGSQRDDWSKRPLTSKQETYALGDVLHLMALATRMTDRLAAAGRIAWAREEFAAMADLPLPVDKRTGPDAFRRIKGSAKLSPRKQAVLRELYDWREARAAAADRPPFKIIAAEALLAMAEDPPETIDEVEDALASHPRLLREADAVLAAIERGLDLPERELPAREPVARTVTSAAGRRRVEKLKAWRDDEAARSRVDPAIAMPLRLIERIAEAAPRTFRELEAIDGVRRWRIDEWGDAILDASA